MDLLRFWTALTESWQIKIFFAGAFTYLFGEYNAGMGGLLCLIALDFLIKIWALAKEAGGFGIAWKTDIINSKGMRQSLFKGMWYMSLLILSHQMEHFTILGFAIGNTPVEITCAYLALIEAKSILENLRDTGMKGLEPFIGLLGKKQNQLTGKRD